MESNPSCVYQPCGRSRRLVIHELCKIVSFPSLPETSGEISDDEDEDAVEPETGSCSECLKEENKRIYDLVRCMIDVSHKMGPVRLFLPPEGLDNEQESSEPVQVDEGYQVHESILTVPDAFGKTPLHVLCENSADTSMMRLLLESTRESTGNFYAPSVLSLITAKDSNGSTPLHYLSYSRTCPFSSLELMMDYCSPQQDLCSQDPSLCTDTDGDTPLHWALDGYMSPRRIKQLMRYHKKALWVSNNVGRRPLDQFVENFVDSDWYLHELCGREIWENIQGYLRIMMEEENVTKEEWLPVHLMAGSSIDFPPVFLDIALHYNKDDLSKTNSKGLLPLHLACARKSDNPNISCDGTVAAKLLQIYPQAAYKTTNDTNRLAIHIAIESQKPLPLIASLLKAYPNSLNIPDPVTRLWPFLLAGVNNEESVDVSYGLLRADPSIVQVTIRNLLSKKGLRAAKALQNMDPFELEEHSSRTMRKLCLAGRDRY